MASLAAATQRITADAAVGTSGNVTLVWGITLLNGTSATDISLRNGTSTSGAILWKLAIPTAVGAETDSRSIAFDKPIVFSSGCFADMTGTAAVAYVAYEDINV